MDDTYDQVPWPSLKHSNTIYSTMYPSYPSESRAGLYMQTRTCLSRFYVVRGADLSNQRLALEKNLPGRTGLLTLVLENCRSEAVSSSPQSPKELLFLQYSLISDGLLEYSPISAVFLKKLPISKKMLFSWKICQFPGILARLVFLRKSKPTA